MTDKIYIIGGGKYGVGKSTITLALVDKLLAEGKSVSFVDGDNRSSDILNAMHGTIPCIALALDDLYGYMELEDYLETHAKTDSVVINTTARNAFDLVTPDAALAEIAHKTKRRIIMLWPITRQQDAINMLFDFLDAAENYDGVYVLLNEYFGDARKFSRYGEMVKSDKPEIKVLSDRISGTIAYPELGDLVSDKIITNKRMLSNADDLMTVDEVSALRQYRQAAHGALNEVVHRIEQAS